MQKYLAIMRVNLLLSVLRQHGATFLMILANIVTLSVDSEYSLFLELYAYPIEELSFMKIGIVFQQLHATEMMIGSVPSAVAQLLDIEVLFFS